MGCGCIEQSKKQSEYENIKRLAKVFAESEKVTVCIFKQGKGYSFIDINCPQFSDITPIEFISALH
jgi:hypothetical protein